MSTALRKFIPRPAVAPHSEWWGDLYSNNRPPWAPWSRVINRCRLCFARRVFADFVSRKWHIFTIFRRSNRSGTQTHGAAIVYSKWKLLYVFHSVFDLSRCRVFADNDNASLSTGLTRPLVLSINATWLVFCMLQNYDIIRTRKLTFSSDLLVLILIYLVYCVWSSYHSLTVIAVGICFCHSGMWLRSFHRRFDTNRTNDVVS